jgi:glycosyltransferase involved in cell wall biosynthesis
VIAAVGVAVPAHNEEASLPACLAAIRRGARALTSVPVHVVVVADACTDRTAELARRSQAAVVEISARNVGLARAAGMRELRRLTRHLDPASVWLATTDADSVVPPGWFADQLRHAAAGWDAIAGTVTVTDWSEHPPGVATAFERRYGGGTDSHPHVHGANLGFRADAYLEAGGFGAEPTAEDHALVTALTAAGRRILRTREIAVVTSARLHGRCPRGFGHLLAGLAAEP